MSGYAKAIVAFLLGGLTALGTAFTDDHVTAAEWVAVAIAAITGGAAVYSVPNRTKSVGDALTTSKSLDPAQVPEPPPD